MTVANEVKAVLKESGINTKGIKVRNILAGYERVITVTVKDLSQDLKEIEKVVKAKFEEIDYDQASGEILSGGNTFVQVNYDEEVMEVA